MEIIYNLGVKAILCYKQFCWSEDMKSGTASVNTDSQWNKQEARFAHATQVWLAVNQSISVTSGE